MHDENTFKKCRNNNKDKGIAIPLLAWLGS